MNTELSATDRGQLQRQLIIFFAATFAFSWGVFALAFLFGLDQSPVVILGVWGPSLMAIVLTGVFYGRSGLGRFFARFATWKTGAKWYLPLLLGFLAIGLLGRFAGSMIAGIEFDPRFWGWDWVLQVMIMQFVIAGLGEEFGWRGFGLQQIGRAHV